MSNLAFTEEAWENYLEWQRTDKDIAKRINELLNDILRHGAAKGIGKPERLKYRKAWSRRINKEHRLIYTEENGMYIIYSLKGHYEEK